MTNSISAVCPIDGAEFTRRLIAAMLPLQRSLKSLHVELGRPKNTVAMQRQLGVGNTICWQVSRIVNAESLVSAARHAPLPQAIIQLLDAAERVGVPVQVLSDVRDAAEGFRGFMREHADDRASFDTLIAGVDDEKDQAQIQVPHRRAAYRAESHIWGVQRDLSVVTALVRRSATGDGFDLAMLLSQFGYRRLRATASATVFAFGVHDNKSPTSMRPLNPDLDEMSDGPLVADFSSDPLPLLERVIVPSNQIVYRLADQSLGRGGSKDLTTGLFVKNGAPVIENGRPSFALTHSIFCPTGRLVMSLFLDRDSFEQRVPTAVTRLHGFGEHDPRGQPLPLNESVLPLGPASRVPDCKGAPKCGEMVQYLADRIGWDLDQFNSYRMTLDFPVFASLISMSVSADSVK